MVIIVSILVILLITIAVVSVVIYYKRKKKTKESDSQVKKIKKQSCEPNYISPKKFSVGWVENSPQHSASACYSNDNAIRYPINPPYVDYGKSPVSDKCECTEFIKPP